MADNNIPNPGTAPLVAVGITILRVAVTQVASWLGLQLLRLGITIDSTQMQMAVWGALSLGYLAVARWREERGKATRMLGIKRPPTYTKPPS
jgi:hypothetical protein